MKKHVELAGVLYMLWGGICALLSLSLLSIGVAAAAIGMASAPGEGGGGTMAAGLVAAAFFALGGGGLLFGGLHAWVGSRVRRFGDHARLVAILLAIVDLFLVPFGTALGVYGLWALLHKASKPLFGR